MISTFDTLNSIEQAGSDLRAEEDALASIIDNTTAEVTDLRAKQATLYKSLARIRLDAIQQEQVSGRLDRAEKRALSALQDQTDKLKDLATDRENLKSQLRKAQQDRTALVAKAADASDAIDALAEATEKRISDDLAWQTQMAAVSGAEDRLLAAEEKASQAESDCEEKSKPYLADKLFVYLWDRGYGTSKYAGGNLAKIGDAYVARTVNYEPARQNYYTLTEIPKRLRDHATRLASVLEQENEKLVALERAALEADGIVEKEQAFAAADAELATLDATIADLEAKERALETDRSALLDGNANSDLNTALNELAASMQRQDLRDLLRDARDTPTTDDERIVKQLQRIERDIDRKERDLEETRQTALDLARKKAELERSRNDFRRNGYDRMGGGFSNDKLIGEVIGGIVGGALSSRELRDALRSGYSGGRRNPSGPRRRTFGGSIRRSSGGGFSTGGGF